MIELPPAILSLYRVAATSDVLGWSYGALAVVRPAFAPSWQETRGTLEDQAIFGPVRDYLCACGRREGYDANGVVCTLCGVKVAPASVRRQRFAHVPLAAPIAHPLAGPARDLEAWPVLPAAYFTSPGGAALADLYDSLLRANALPDPAPLERAVRDICQLLAPLFLQAHNWNLSDAHTLARGIALEHQPAVGEDDRCDHCGYPLAGLNAAVCPNCGHRLHE